MPAWPSSVITSTKSSTVSVSGFCRPVRTLASLIGVASGRVTEESLTQAMVSRVASP